MNTPDTVNVAGRPHTAKLDIETPLGTESLSLKQDTQSVHGLAAWQWQNPSQSQVSMWSESPETRLAVQLRFFLLRRCMVVSPRLGFIVLGFREFRRRIFLTVLILSLLAGEWAACAHPNPSFQGAAGRDVSAFGQYPSLSPQLRIHPRVSHFQVAPSQQRLR